jgi:hypothetical protein
VPRLAGASYFGDGPTTKKPRRSGARFCSARVNELPDALRQPSAAGSSGPTVSAMQPCGPDGVTDRLWTVVDIAAIVESARAQARGVRFGRKPKLTAHQIVEAKLRRRVGEALTEIGRSYNVSHSTISRL